MGKGKYCSTKCQHEGRKNGKTVKCYVCGNDTYKTKRDLNRSKSKKYFCGKSCQTKWRNREFIGSKHGNWKHGEFSYRSVLDRNNVEKICKLCGEKDERVLQTHHIDRDRTNNKLSNLMWLCCNCHFLVHRHKGEEEKLMETLV